MDEFVRVVEFSATSDVTAYEVERYHRVIAAVSGDLGLEVRLSAEVLRDGRRVILASVVTPWDENESYPILVMFDKDMGSMFAPDTFNTLPEHDGR